MERKILQIAFLRNEKIYSSRRMAENNLKKIANSKGEDGNLILSRYREKNSSNIKTIFGIVYSDGINKFITIFEGESFCITNANKYHYENLYKKNLE